MTLASFETKRRHSQLKVAIVKTAILSFCRWLPGEGLLVKAAEYEGPENRVPRDVKPCK